jgi:hypothetical protein
MEGRPEMIVQRVTTRVKPGNEEHVVEMLKAARAANENPSRMRIYSPNIGPFNFVSFEIEFEKLAEYDEFWTEWNARPETAAFMGKWNELVDIGGANEVWTLAE